MPPWSMAPAVSKQRTIFQTGVPFYFFHSLRPSYLDFINLMAYDFHGKWERETGHNAPLYAPSSDSEWRKQLSVDNAASLWVKLGAPKDKLVIGMPTYGRTFTLSNTKQYKVEYREKRREPCPGNLLTKQ